MNSVRGKKKKSWVRFYYECLVCGRKSNTCKDVEYISHGGLDDIPSVEYRRECNSCGMPVVYRDSYERRYNGQCEG